MTSDVNSRAYLPPAPSATGALALTLPAARSFDVISGFGFLASAGTTNRTPTDVTSSAG